MTTKGHIYVVSAPSGGGKHTLISNAMKYLTHLRYSVSATTRKPRKGERDGEHYHFMDRDEFERARDEGAFLEWAEVHGNLYGTLRGVVDDLLRGGDDVILELDIQGMRQVRDSGIGCTTIFIAPPSIEELEKRLQKRGADSPEAIATRLENAKAEMAAQNEYDHVIVNDDIEEAKAAFLDLLTPSG